MGTIVRAGLNPDLIDVLRRAAAPATPGPVPTPAAVVSAPDTPAPEPMRSRRARRAAKAVARRGLRLARPVLRPLAIRARTYLTAEVRDGQFHEANRSIEAFAELGRSLSTATETLLARTHAVHQLVEQSFDDERRRTALALEQLHSSLDDLDDRIDTLRGQIDDVGAVVSGMPSATVRLDDGSIMIRTRAGFVVCSNDDERLIAGLVDSGDVERGTRLLFERLLKPGDVFVDAGANVGVHTVAAARAVGPTGRVLAFEPFPKTAGLLRRTVVINGFESFVAVHEVGLGEIAGEAQLHLGEMSGHHSLFELAHHEVGTCTVAVRRLDDVLEPGSGVTVLKIDVEGAELDVVRGASRTLNENPHMGIVAEFGPSHLRRVGISATEWIESIVGPRWQWRVIEPLSGRLVECELDDLMAVESSNLLLADVDSDVWRRAAG